MVSTTVVVSETVGDVFGHKVEVRGTVEEEKRKTVEVVLTQ